MPFRAMNSEFDEHGIIEKIKISSIDHDEEHVRTDVSEKRVQEIANSIREQGLIERPEVTEKENGRYEVVVGSLRLQAMERLGFEEVSVKKIDISGMDKVERQLASNTARAEMNTMDKIEAAGELSNHLENSQQLENSEGRGPDGVKSLLAERLGVSRNTITKWMRVFNEASERQKQELREGGTSLTRLNQDLNGNASDGIGGQEEEFKVDEGSSRPPTAQIKSGISSISSVDESEMEGLPEEDKQELAERFEKELWGIYCGLRGDNKAKKFFEEKAEDLRGDEDGPK